VCLLIIVVYLTKKLGQKFDIQIFFGKVFGYLFYDILGLKFVISGPVIIKLDVVFLIGVSQKPFLGLLKR
jgi:hypothetical protein